VGPDIVAIPGTTTRGHLEENFAAAEIALGASEPARLHAAAPHGVTPLERRVL
jgi:aryl-alcohol dehydrogenase-like predicted oxidoreductase